MELLIGLVVGSFLGACFYPQARWCWRLATGGYLFKEDVPVKEPVDKSNP